VHVVCQTRLVTTTTSRCRPTTRIPPERYTPSSRTASRRFFTSAVGFF
jgi:hypothetical protein